MARKAKATAAEPKAPAAAATATEAAAETNPEQGALEGQAGADVGGETTTPPAPEAPVKAPAAKQVQPKPILVTIRTKGRKVTRRRAGMRFGFEPVTVDAATLSDAQKAAIAADPLLIVEDVKDT